MPTAAVIGAGFAGLSAACHLARHGLDVTVVDRHPEAGGRARTWSHDGYTFDMGPSWYWMPDVFERFFAAFGDRVTDHYRLRRLDPSYRVVWPGGEAWDVPADPTALQALFERQQPGGAQALRRFLDETGEVYRQAMDDYLFRPSVSLKEYASPRLVVDAVRLRMLTSMQRYARSRFDDERLARLVEWPVLFLGADARQTPAVYSLMSYADMALGTWYPEGGMHRIVQAMVAVAERLGVRLHLGCEVQRVRLEGDRAVGLVVDGEPLDADVVVAAADYRHVELDLLPPRARQFSARWWDRRTFSPSSLLAYLGVEGPVGDLPHHALFFDADLDAHMDAVYRRPRWPTRPLFYACAPSTTDPTLAPEGCSTLFLLVPLAPGLPDDDAARQRTLDAALDRLEAHTGTPIRSRLRVQRTYAMRDFVEDHHAAKGNAYGLANTLAQTGPFKPPLRSRRVEGLYFAGQLTVPGPGMPPSLVSGELAADLVAQDLAAAG